MLSSFGTLGSAPMNVRITQLDGTLPNLALMRLAHWHRERGDAIHFSRSPYRQLDEPAYGAVYASAIFSFSADRLRALQQEFPAAIVGGTGTKSALTVDDITGAHTGWEQYDYSLYPGFTASLGFTQRGCRMKCKFCVVPGKEGKPRSVSTIHDLWRGGDHPKHIHLLDNDFFGQEPDAWRARIAEIQTGGFKVCLNQGINVRLIDDHAAEALASIDYRGNKFGRKRLYTAWDNLKDEAVFFRGVDRLEAAGVPSSHLMAYMLVGFAKDETMERILHRFDRMVERRILPYVMVYDRSRRDLIAFQRWSNSGVYRSVPWRDFRPYVKRSAIRPDQGSLSL